MSTDRKITSQHLSELICKVNPAAKSIISEPNLNLFTSGILDSISVIQLVQEIEGEFNVSFDYSDLKPHQFMTIDIILDLLKRNYNFK